MCTPSNPQPPRLLDQVKQVMRLKHYSLRTEESYIHYIRQYILFHNKCHPKEMGVDEIRAYFSYLAVEKNVAASTQNVALSALLFLYQQVLKIELPYIDHIERAQKPARLPVVFTRTAVKQVFESPPGSASPARQPVVWFWSSPERMLTAQSEGSGF